MLIRCFLVLLLAAGALAYGLPKEFLQSRLESADTAAICLQDLKGKTVLICLAGRKSFEAGHTQLANLVKAFPGRSELTALMVADLPGVPGFVKSAVIKNIEESHARTSALIGRAPTFYSLLDWEGVYSRQLGASGETNDSYFLIVVDRHQRLTHRSQQNLNGVSEEQLFRETRQCLAELLKVNVK